MKSFPNVFPLQGKSFARRRNDLSTASMASPTGLSRIKLFMALSRTPHGLLDMATPAMAAMLWLGHVPSAPVVILGLITAFAGYTAVYALNDVVDYRVDREKFQSLGLETTGNDLDSVFVRHPLAQGLLTLKEGILWTAGWGTVALVGAYMLNPLCALVFLAGCLLEAIYCLLLRVSYFRTAVSGGVKTAGGLAAVFAVTSDPSAIFLVLLFLWLFSWEVGGQNVPNDWTDMDADRDMKAQTIPVRLGTERAARIILRSLVGSVLLSLVLYAATPASLHLIYLPGALLIGGVLLLLPAWKLHQSLNREHAAALFNRASYYPLCMFLLVTVSAFLS